ncbi:MAG: hypothetical protein LUH15_12380 [Tannerellaceae bacterium]|nr:hypothetical protein [Tannerellaceae bacterium]
MQRASSPFILALSPLKGVVQFSPWQSEPSERHHGLRFPRHLCALKGQLVTCSHFDLGIQPENMGYVSNPWWCSLRSLCHGLNSVDLNRAKK